MATNPPVPPLKESGSLKRAGTLYNIPKELRNDFDAEELAEHERHFKGFDNDSGLVQPRDIKKLWASFGIKLKKKDISDLFAKCSIEEQKPVNFQQWLAMAAKQKGKKDHGHKVIDGQMHVRTATAGAKHMISLEETAAFSKHINQRLGNDPDLQALLPLNPDSMDLYHAVRDGVLLIKMINLAEADTVDMRAVNVPKKGKVLSIFEMRENNNLVIESAKAIGCKVVGVHNHSLIEGPRCPHLVLGLVWQIVKIQLMSQINLKNHPELYLLLKEGEELSKLLALTPEQLLIRWVNYHMKEAGNSRTLTRKTFVREIKDSEIYTVLLNRLGDIDGKPTDLKALGVDKGKKQERARHVLRNAESLGVKPILTAKDIAQGNKKLNYAFLAEIFNSCPGLTITEEEAMEAAALIDEDGEGTREERVYRMWINSLNIDDLYVTNLYEDGRDGLLWLKICDHIDDTCVNWDKVNKKKKKMNVYKRNENCSMAIKIMKDTFKFSLVGIGGVDLEKRHKMYCLACMWQLMRLYTVNLLTRLGGGKRIEDKKIVKWANEKVKCSGAASNNKDKTLHQMKSFRDSSLGNGLFFMDLVYAMEPRAVNWDIVEETSEQEGMEQNAKYVISVARKLGAAIFITYEDIVEVNPKMLMLLTAALMAVDLGFDEVDGVAEDVDLDADEDVVQAQALARSVKRGHSAADLDELLLAEEAKAE